ncbi:MAG: bifunctional phosphopantothenoylcysteine decarboxylase/phosphopantothenate--cysteine ligase CoaBC [Planctomycetota bacterium]
MAPKNSKLNKLNILLGVTGGIAAYKAVDLASKLAAAGAQVKTVMTASATRLVRPRSFEAVTQSSVYTTMWQEPGEFEISHISLADWADIVVIAPATANVLGKMANGLCDDLLTTTLCAAWTKPILLAPAMNENMWNNPAVKWNVKSLQQMGIMMIGPARGRLACGTEGVGRMAEPADILEALEKIASKIKSKK